LVLRYRSRKVNSQKSEREFGRTIGFIEGKGTTTEQQSYSYIDGLTLTPNLNLTNTLHYRLKQIDYDGTSVYSDIVEVEFSFVPSEYILYQNYPNPFNPGTKISWQSPVGSHQVLKVFNVLGREVATLLMNYKEAGFHEVEFNSAALASGVYYYQLKAGLYKFRQQVIRNRK
jgi:hypothetical protein